MTNNQLQELLSRLPDDANIYTRIDKTKICNYQGEPVAHVTRLGISEDNKADEHTDWGYLENFTLRATRHNTKHILI